MFEVFCWRTSFDDLSDSYAKNVVGLYVIKHYKVSVIAEDRKIWILHWLTILKKISVFRVHSWIRRSKIKRKPNLFRYSFTFQISLSYVLLFAVDSYMTNIFFFETKISHDTHTYMYRLSKCDYRFALLLFLYVCVSISVFVDINKTKFYPVLI